MTETKIVAGIILMAIGALHLGGIAGLAIVFGAVLVLEAFVGALNADLQDIGRKMRR